MPKNLIADVCKLLGVEIGEKFNVKPTNVIGYNKDFSNAYPLYIDDDGEVRKSEDNRECLYLNLLSFIKGNYEIVKLPYRPKKDEQYFYLAGDGNLSVYSSRWSNAPAEVAMLKFGWIWRTEEEARKAIPMVVEEIRQELGEEDS